MYTRPAMTPLKEADFDSTTHDHTFAGGPPGKTTEYTDHWKGVSGHGRKRHPNLVFRISRTAQLAGTTVRVMAQTLIG